MCTPNNTEFVKQKLTEMKGEMDKFKITDGDLNTTISTRIKEKKFSKAIENLNTINQLDLNGIFRKLNSITAEYIFFANCMQYLPICP